jgi:hypothetical protein
VVLKGGTLKIGRENTIYILISIFVIILIFSTVIFTSNDIYEAYIDDSIIGDNWYEDVSGRYFDERSFGLEKQISFMYRFHNSEYPSFLTVNTYKTLFMMNEEDLIEKTIETIENAVKEKNVILNKSSIIKGNRVLKNNHKSLYVLYNGTKSTEDKLDKVHIIGETWNCKESGTSIIVIGYAQTTNVSNDKPQENISHWAKVVRDEGNTFGNYFDNTDYIFIGNDGLIFNVKCH